MQEITPTEPCRVTTTEPHPPSAFAAAGATHPGEVRETNDDAFRIEPALGLIVVADGVAGTKGGGAAAITVVNTVCTSLLARMAESSRARPVSLSDRTDALATALVEAHARVRAEATRTSQPDMATTVTALWCAEDHAIVMHAGDSRAYRLRGGKLEPLTADHSLAAEYARRHGAIPPELDRNCRHILTRSVSARASEVHPEGRAFPLLPGDAFVVCTDGLTGGVPDAVIAYIVQRANEREAAETLVSLACDAGGFDNITVAIASWRGTASQLSSDLQREGASGQRA